jgi:hypothetical protein
MAGLPVVAETLETPLRSPRAGRPSTLAEPTYIGSLGARRVGQYHPAEEVRRDIPLSPLVGDDRHRLLVVAGQHAFDPALPRWPEGHPVTDFEFQHFRVRPHLVEQAEARDDTVVKVDEFGLCQLVDIDLHGIPGLRGEDTFKINIPRLTRVVTSPREALDVHFVG